jgi:hypothetical protein
MDRRVFTWTLMIAASCRPATAEGPSAPVTVVVEGRGGDAGGSPATIAAIPEGDSSPDAGEPTLCGCSLCAPLFSDDACTTDADCAPETPCHARACVAKSHATLPEASSRCTHVMRCATADANACGCLRGRCALYARH